MTNLLFISYLLFCGIRLFLLGSFILINERFKEKKLLQKFMLKEREKEERTNNR